MNVKWRDNPVWLNLIKDKYYHIFRTLLRKKFGELFYRVFIMDMVPHPKGMMIESLALLDPSSENRNDLEEIFRAQSKTNNIGYFGFGPYSYYVEEMKAAPMRFCSYLNRDQWYAERIQEHTHLIWYS